MKNKKKIFGVCGILIAVMTLICFVPSIHAIKADNKEAPIDEMIAAQAKAVEANEALMQYFFDKGWVTEYPDYFGGCYIEDNIFCIRLVLPTEEEMTAIKSVLSEYENVVSYEYTDYSLSSIQKYADTIAIYLKEQGIKVTHWCVKADSGKIIIGVKADDIESALAMVTETYGFSSKSNYPDIIIEEGDFFVTDSNEVFGGSMIFVGASTVSAGACGSYNGQNALVTCGHIRATVGSSFQLGYAVLGSVSNIQHADGQAGDFSIITLNDAAIVTHTVGDSRNGYIVIDGGTYLNPAIGTYVKRYGDSTKYSYAEVIDTNVTVSYNNNISITGMTLASIYSGLGAESGDSGGPYLVGDRFCGVHSGHPTSDNTVVSFTPYSLIASAGFTVFSSHNCARWTDTGPSTHSGYCIICNETVYQGHADYWNSTINRCLRCGRTDIIVVP